MNPRAALAAGLSLSGVHHPQRERLEVRNAQAAVTGEAADSADYAAGIVSYVLPEVGIGRPLVLGDVALGVGGGGLGTTATGHDAHRFIAARRPR